MCNGNDGRKERKKKKVCLIYNMVLYESSFSREYFKLEKKLFQKWNK